MSKQQMAEWLAECVLGWEKEEKTFSRLRRNMWKSSIDSNLTTFGWISDLQGVIYSPDGFFAVWDAVEDKFAGIDCSFWRNDTTKFLCCFDMYFIEAFKMINACGKDRYEAFYNAVYEAMNEKINTNS